MNAIYICIYMLSSLHATVGVPLGIELIWTLYVYVYICLPHCPRPWKAGGDFASSNSPEARDGLARHGPMVAKALGVSLGLEARNLHPPLPPLAARAGVTASNLGLPLSPNNILCVSLSFDTFVRSPHVWLYLRSHICMCVCMCVCRKESGRM